MTARRGGSVKYYAVAHDAHGAINSIVEMEGRRRLRRFLRSLGRAFGHHRIYTQRRARELWPGLGVRS